MKFETDPFRNEVRRYIPLEQYWSMVERYKKKSLIHMESFDESTHKARIAELTAAEKSHGFVYEGELLWLTALLTGEFDKRYSDWVHHIIDNCLAAQPLRWAALEHIPFMVPDGTYDVWASFCSEENARSILPFKLIPELDQTEIFSDCSPAFAVFGKRERPSSSHLIKLFERLHNLPYYVLEHKKLVTYDPNESEYGLTELGVIDLDDPDKWTMGQNNMYSAPCSWDFQGRKHIPHDTEGFPTAIQDMVERHQDQEWEQLKANGAQFVPTRIEHKYLKHLPLELVENQFRLHDQQRHGDGTIRTKALLRDVEVTFPSGLVKTCNLTFDWGQSTDWQEYQFGDAIRWGVNSTGHPGLHLVYVLCQTEPCGNSNSPQMQSMLMIRDGIIETIAHEIMEQVEFDFQAPFVDVNGELIHWEQHELARMREFVLSAFTPDDHPEARDLIYLLEKECREVKTYVNWIFSKYREQLTPEQLKWGLTFSEAVLFGTSPKYSHDCRIMSNGVFLHEYEHSGEPIQHWYQFDWGSRLNFPSYHLGDRVQWSDYSFGEPNVPLVYVKATSARWRPIFLKIEFDVITEIIEDCSTIENEWDSYKAYVDGHPYLIEPPSPSRPLGL